MLLVFGLLVAPVPGSAKGGGAKARAKIKAKAKRFEKKGKRAYTAKRWDDAISAFELAYATKPIPRYLFNIGRSWERKGDLLKAIEFVEQYVGEESDPEERADGEETVLMLRQKLGRTVRELRLDSIPPGALVRMVAGSVEVSGVTPFRKWIPQATYELTVSHKGFLPDERALEVGAGDPIELQVELMAVGETPTAVPPKGDSDAKPESKAEPARIAKDAPEGARTPPGTAGDRRGRSGVRRK